MPQKFKLSLPEIDITQNFPLEKIFITSDLHLFHTNIIKYTDRPFEYSEDGCHEMNEFILSKFDVLPNDCLVWNLGDVLLNRHVSAECAEATVKRIVQGHTVNLFLGNHDKQCNKKPFATFIEYFTSLGFDGVFNQPHICGKYVFSHEPVYIEPGSGYINIHGHTHNMFVKEDYFLSEYNRRYPKQKVNPADYINVCMDANRFEILSLADLMRA